MELTESQKKVYEIIAVMLRNCTEGLVNVSAKDASDVSVAYKAVNIDYPEYFWMPLNYIIAEQDGKIYIAMKYKDESYTFDYLYSDAEIEAASTEIKAVTDEFLKTINEDDSDYTKELKIHDYLCEKIAYPHDYGQSYDFNIYGALLKGRAVCEGYSRAFQYLCRKADINCILVTGDSKSEGHMWNQVKIDGEWYNVDVTWNDSESVPVWHSYFNLDDTALSIDHEFDPMVTTLTNKQISDDRIQYNIVRKVCESLEYSYATVNDMYIKNDPEDSRFAITSAILKAFSSEAEYVDLFIASEVELKGTKIDEIYTVYGIDKCFEAAGNMILSSGKLYTKTSLSRNGRGYRIYYEALE